MQCSKIGCGAYALKGGSGLCFFHDPDKKQARKDAATKGGRHSKGKAIPTTLQTALEGVAVAHTELVDITSIEGLRDIIRRLIASLLASDSDIIARSRAIFYGISLAAGLVELDVEAELDELSTKVEAAMPAKRWRV